MNPSEKDKMSTEITEKEIEMVQQSWEKCVPIADKAAVLFYGKLFELDPSLRSMFKSDMAEQGKKLMTMITVAVRSLNRLETIVEDVRKLGVRHKDYGVKDEHYDTVGAALLWTLGQALGESFDEELKTAWTKVYTLLATAMKDAANQSAHPA